MARKNEPYIYKVLRRETPNPRQQAFFRAEAANIAYGGARGGGKSWAMRRKLVLLAMRYPGLKLLLLRRTLPLLRYDAHAPEDVDTRQEDHIADEIRYLCQSDPIAPRPVVQRTPKVFDPLSSD